PPAHRRSARDETRPPNCPDRGGAPPPANHEPADNRGPDGKESRVAGVEGLRCRQAQPLPGTGRALPPGPPQPPPACRSRADPPLPASSRLKQRAAATGLTLGPCP